MASLLKEASTTMLCAVLRHRRCHSNRVPSCSQRGTDDERMRPQGRTQRRAMCGLTTCVVCLRLRAPVAPRLFASSKTSTAQHRNLQRRCVVAPCAYIARIDFSLAACAPDSDRCGSRPELAPGLKWRGRAFRSRQPVSGASNNEQHHGGQSAGAGALLSCLLASRAGELIRLRACSAAPLAED